MSITKTRLARLLPAAVERAATQVGRAIVARSLATPLRELGASLDEVPFDDGTGETLPPEPPAPPEGDDRDVITVRHIAAWANDLPFTPIHLQEELARVLQALDVNGAYPHTDYEILLNELAAAIQLELRSDPGFFHLEDTLPWWKVSALPIMQAVCKRLKEQAAELAAYGEQVGEYHVDYLRAYDALVAAGFSPSKAAALLAK